MKHLTDLLTLPGNGVFTVNAGKEKKEKLLKAYFGTKDSNIAQAKWQKKISRLSSEVPWVIGIPSDSGGGIQRGANWGPLVLRREILDIKDRFLDLGDVRVIPHLLHDKYLNSETIKECRRALYGRDLNLPVSPLSIAEMLLEDLYKTHPGARIFGLGGDHSTSYPLVKTWLKSRKNLSEAAILHFDAHTDLLDKRLGIDLCFGTWTYQILKYLKSRNHILQIGIRSSGKNKRYWKQHVGVEQLWSQEVNKQGAEKTYKKIRKHYINLGVKEIYISFDIDAIDEQFASATGTPEKGGLKPTDCAAIIRMLSQDFKISGGDLMEVAPFIIPEGIEQRDQKASIQVAADMARLLLGRL